MTPTLAAAICLARRWASVAPTRVMRMLLPVDNSTSRFKSRIVAMMSALWTRTTRGIEPCNSR